MLGLATTPRARKRANRFLVESVANTAANSKPDFENNQQSEFMMSSRIPLPSNLPERTAITLPHAHACCLSYLKCPADIDQTSLMRGRSLAPTPRALALAPAGANCRTRRRAPNLALPSSPLPPSPLRPRSRPTPIFVSSIATFRSTFGFVGAAPSRTSALVTAAAPLQMGCPTFHRARYGFPVRSCP